MSNPADIRAEAEAVRRALADLRARLDRQESAIVDGFRSLRNELETLDRQVHGLTQAAAAEAADVSEPSARQPTPVSKAVEPAPAQAVPVGVPVGEAAADPAATAGDFNFGDADSQVAADPSEFNFASPTSAPTPSEESTAARPGPARPAAGTGEQIDMEQVMFGPDLAANQSLFDDRSALLQGLYSSDPAAMTLLGQLLIFRGATPDRMPGLLKDIGEAYYRWRGGAPDHDHFRDELTGWLQRKCDEAGAPNTIELVRAGDRYDSKRHHAKERGVEVSAVHGWVVLRDNGKVYTKATVALK